MHKAPRIGEDVLITDRTEPPLTFAVSDVVGFDAEHEAWQVRVTARRPEMGCMALPDTTLWVRPIRSDAWNPVIAEWRLYDINSPLPAKVQP
jgi:hypothetical protein